MDICEVEQYLTQLKFVECCKILLDREGEIQEVHIISKSGRSPKQISRDIQSILISRFGLMTDYKKISIAQIEQTLKDYTDTRLKLKAVEYSVDEMKADVKVILEKEDALYTGTTSGPYTSNNILRMLAKAALSAVEDFYGVSDAFVLEDINTLSSTGKEVVVTVISALFDGREQLLSGSAMVNGDKKETVVKATLDAVNRVVVKIPR